MTDVQDSAKRSQAKLSTKHLNQLDRLLVKLSNEIDSEREEWAVPDKYIEAIKLVRGAIDTQIECAEAVEA